MWCKYALYRNLANTFRVGQVNSKFSTISSLAEKSIFGEVAQVKGWVKNLRVHKDLIFADISDGSCAQHLQIIIAKNLQTDGLTYGSSVQITGKLSKSPRGQPELVAEAVEVLGPCVVHDGYPFHPRKTYAPEYVRQFLHLRSRTNYISAILRVRNAVTKHIHDYFASKGYLLIHAPILTSNDCEGAGEVFKVLPDDEETIRAMAPEGIVDKETVYFGAKTFLSVSGQLHLEAMCRGMGDVYTLGPTFRAENSRTRLHLSEFYMLEAEIAFCDTLQALQNVIEELLKYIFSQTRNSNEADLHIIDKNVKPPMWLDKNFVTLTYEEARDILHKKGIGITAESINKEQELALVSHCNGIPVFVTRWPKDLKSFYMKECNDDNSKVDALDLLTPITGEVVGGSLREDDYDKLKLKLPSDRLNWYLELRKFGNIPTAGFGLGLERLLQVMCGVENIKDTLPFPRWPHHCEM